MLRIPVAQRKVQAVTREEVISGNGRRVGRKPLARDLRRAGGEQDQSASKRRTRFRK